MRSPRRTPARAWPRRASAWTLALASAGTVGSLRAAAPSRPPEPSAAEVEAWLDARSIGGGRSIADDGAPPEAPPPPPRWHGFVVQSTLGALGHLGPMKNVSPTAPWLHALVGFEPFRWAMVFVEGDVSFTSTRYANPPPNPRAYALYGLGGGLRFTVKPHDRVGIYAQGSAGAAALTEDVLVAYGYRDSTELAPYFGGHLGLEWHQVNPHLAFVLHGGVRNYDRLLDRERSSETALAWMSGLALRYVF
ncbi:MAG: hypothetical protein IT376_10105 [Polyangiaceae bacterium]|nr:hypothetical protein [Polyangiaceae bacterium]